jgi:hypothetical protein
MSARDCVLDEAAVASAAKAIAWKRRRRWRDPVADELNDYWATLNVVEQDAMHEQARAALQAAQPCGGEGRGGWRILEAGETIQPGDEYFHENGRWFEVVMGGEHDEADWPIRRRCTFTDAGQAGGEK